VEERDEEGQERRGGEVQKRRSLEKEAPMVALGVLVAELQNPWLK